LNYKEKIKNLNKTCIAAAAVETPNKLGLQLDQKAEYLTPPFFV
jgi:hypothetical protein